MRAPSRTHGSRHRGSNHPPTLCLTGSQRVITTRRLYVAELRERADRAEREREERAEAAVASERARIARELHDIVAHSVSVMVVQAEAADEMLDRDRPDRARAPVWKIQEPGCAALRHRRPSVALRLFCDTNPCSCGSRRRRAGRGV